MGQLGAIDVQGTAYLAKVVVIDMPDSKTEQVMRDTDVDDEDNWVRKPKHQVGSYRNCATLCLLRFANKGEMILCVPLGH